MIRKGLISLCFVVPAAGFAQERDCADPVSQSDMNTCAYEAWQRADVDLNDTYARAMEVARGWSDGAAEALRAAQRAWIPYRDAACTAEGFLFEGGSMEPFIVNSCLEHLTRQRTEELRAVYEMN
ncbi:lysozyme inhibitor LprI family protein [Celeribacter sp.]|uniref:lysozyme inhibitor LprI family protein n=1 Tax=Celeribacter sp. TaxID=1890673 RepID=UPI003A94AB2A